MSREAESEAIQRSLDCESVTGGDVITIGTRMLRVCGKPGEVLTDHRGRVGVRNLETGRLSYMPERRLRDARDAGKRGGADHVYDCGCYWFSGNIVACRLHAPR